MIDFDAKLLQLSELREITDPSAELLVGVEKDGELPESVQSLW